MIKKFLTAGILAAAMSVLPMVNGAMAEEVHHHYHHHYVHHNVHHHNVHHHYVHHHHV